MEIEHTRVTVFARARLIFFCSTNGHASDNGNHNDDSAPATAMCAFIFRIVEIFFGNFAASFLLLVSSAELIKRSPRRWKRWWIEVLCHDGTKGKKARGRTLKPPEMRVF